MRIIKTSESRLLAETATNNNKSIRFIWTRDQRTTGNHELFTYSLFFHYFDIFGDDNIIRTKSDVSDEFSRTILNNVHYR